jgi:trehalose synthase
MPPKLKNYTRFVGKETINRIKESAKPLRGKDILHINTVSFGGGVAEILNTLVLLMTDVGIKAGWRILKASPDFFFITKEFHNAMQGSLISLTPRKRRTYLEYIHRNALMYIVEDNDFVVIHDPQPVALIKYCKKEQPWIWRCHIDITSPDPEMWNFIVPFVKRYDAMIITDRKYKKTELGIRQEVITPTINPLSSKNRELTEKEMRRILYENNIDTSKPIITQVSRFDKWKDPLGVVDIYRKIKEKIDCQLIMVGNIVEDDPEGKNMLHKLTEKTREQEDDIHIITNAGDLTVNAIQRASSIVMQKSIKEGFGMTVTEALWKEKPVIGTNAGGIPLQVINGKTGFIIDSIEQGVDACVKLLRDEKLREKMGQQAREHVRRNFLITKHLENYIKLFNSFLPYKV